MRPMEEADVFAARAYRTERLRMHEVELGSRNPRSLSPQREVGARIVSWRRDELVGRDQDFSDRGEIREPQLRRIGLMDRDQDFGDKGEIMEPQLRRSGLMDRNQDFSYEGDIMESQLRRVLMVRDQDFSDRGDVMEPHLWSGLMDRDQDFGDRRDIMEPQLRRSGLMVRDQDFSDRGDVMEPQLRRRDLMVRDEEISYRSNVVQPKLKSLAYRQVDEKPRDHYRASLSRDEKERRYELVDYENRYEDARVGVDYDYEYDGARGVQGHNANQESVLGSVHHRGLDRHKLLALEDGSSRGAHTLPFDSQSGSKYVEMARSPLSAHVQPRQVRLNDEVARYPDPFLLEKLSAIEMLEREERSRLHPKDVSLYLESTSRSKDLAASSQYKECLTTSSGTSRMNYAPLIQDDMHLLGDIHLRGSKLRQPFYLNEYGENHSYNTMQDYAAGHKELTSYQYDKVSSPRGDNMDYVYPKGRPRDTSDYGHSYERTSLLEQEVLDKRHARAQILLEPLRENINDTEFPQRDVINSSSRDHHSLNKLPVSMSFFDGKSLVRSSQSQFYVDSGDTNVDTQNLRESDIQNDVPCHEEIPQRRLDYHSRKDEHSNSYDERWRRPPRLEHEMDMVGDRVRLKMIESGVIGYNGHSLRSVKRKCILDEKKMGHNSGPIVFSNLKRNINRAQDIDYRNEVWDDQYASALPSPENFEDDKWFGEAERTYSGDLYGRVAATDGLLSYRGSIDQGQRHLIRPCNPDKKQKVHENPSSLRQYVSIQCNRKHHLTKNVWIRGKDDKQTEASHHVVEELRDQVAYSKTELPENSIEFRQLVHNFFLSYTKKLNQSVATQKRYKEQGKAGGLYCIVCANSQLKEFKDARSLATHCFMSQKVGLKAKHLGLHKAICVLMGWNSDAAPEGKLWIPVAVPAPNALAQKEDLILWPPVVVIHNCSGLVTGLEGQNVKTTEAVEDFLRGKGFSGGRMKVRLAKPGSSSVLLVKFLGTIPGFQDAEKLHNCFFEEERGRKDFGVVTSTKGKDIDNRNRKGDKVEELLLYGYMGIAEDLDKVDIDTKRKCLIKSKKEIRDFVDAPVNPVEED